jgi:hypothetical protein
MRNIDTEHIDGMLRGAVGSLAGLAVMGLFFRAAGALANHSESAEGAAGNGAGNSAGNGVEQPDPLQEHHELDDIAIAGQQTRDDEPATETLGRLTYERATGHEPDEEVKHKLGQAVHWGYGVLMGGVYGAMRPEADVPDLVAGLGYGTALWVLGDELMVPLLGLAGGPTAHSIPDHAKGLGAHLAFGAATATATQALRRVM